MKRILAIALLFLCTPWSKADQLAYISKEEATAAVEFLQTQPQVILFCACCDFDPSEVVSPTNVYSEYTGFESFYQVVLVGNTSTGEEVTRKLDLAYVHYFNEGKAYNVGLALGLKCDPCIEPFDWPTEEQLASAPADSLYYVEEFPTADGSDGEYADTIFTDSAFYLDAEAPLDISAFGDTALPDWSGIYIGDNGVSLEISGPTTDGVVYFRFQQASEFCAEDFLDQAYLTKLSIANYSPSESTCHINFQFGEEMISVLEYGDCGHGARCGSYEGSYKLKKD
jgi:hypothetical protein